MASVRPVEYRNTERHQRGAEPFAHGEDFLIVEVSGSGSAKVSKRGITSEHDLRPIQLEPQCATRSNHPCHVAAQIHRESQHRPGCAGEASEVEPR